MPTEIIHTEPGETKPHAGLGQITATDSNGVLVIISAPMATAGTNTPGDPHQAATVKPRATTAQQITP